MRALSITATAIRVIEAASDLGTEFSAFMIAGSSWFGSVATGRAGKNKRQPRREASGGRAGFSLE
jgi:hypothetical protein